MISLIIPTYNRKALNEKCFAQALKDRTDLEVIWVDDGSTDGTQESLHQFNPDIAVINKTNGGIARSYNQGVKMAKGDWIAIMDADFFMPDNWLSTLKEYIAKRPADIIGIMIDGFPRWSGDMNEGVIAMKHIMGFYAVSKEFFAKAGLYNENIGWYGPIDVYWNNQAKQIPHTRYFIPNLKIQHLGTGEWDSGEYRIKKDQGLRDYGDWEKNVK